MQGPYNCWLDTFSHWWLTSLSTKNKKRNISSNNPEYITPLFLSSLSFSLSLLSTPLYLSLPVSFHHISRAQLSLCSPLNKLRYTLDIILILQIDIHLLNSQLTYALYSTCISFYIGHHRYDFIQSITFGSKLIARKCSLLLFMLLHFITMRLIVNNIRYDFPHRKSFSKYNDESFPIDEILYLCHFVTEYDNEHHWITRLLMCVLYLRLDL